METSGEAKNYPDEVTYNKLVRDRIPEIIGAGGLQVETRELSKEEIISELLVKAAEEGKELAEAVTEEEIKKEMADLLEVIRSLAERMGIEMSEIEAIMEERAQKRGRFEKGIYLVRTYK